MIACGMPARRGNIWVDRYYPISMCIAAWMSMTAIQTVKIASTTKAITSLTSLYRYRACLTSFINLCANALLTSWENYSIGSRVCQVYSTIHACSNTIGDL